MYWQIKSVLRLHGLIWTAILCSGCMDLYDHHFVLSHTDLYDCHFVLSHTDLYDCQFVLRLHGPI